MRIPLPSTIDGTPQIPKQTQWINNLIPIVNANGINLVSRPSCQRIAALDSGLPRGTFIRDGELYSVFGQSLYKGLDLEFAGSIRGVDAVSVAHGFNSTAIATGGVNYLLTDELNEVGDVDILPSSSVTRVDGVFVWTPADGSPLVYSEVNDAGNADPLDFFDAETSIDVNKRTVNIRNDLFVFGEESIERFRLAAGAGANDGVGFARVNNSIISVGYIGGLVETQDQFIFLGQDKDGGFRFFIFNGSQPVVISNAAINEILNENYTIDQLRDVEGQRFNWFGVDVYAFNLPDRDIFVVIEGENIFWGYLSSGSENWRDIERWGFSNAIFFDGDWYCQRRDGLYKFTNDDSDSSGEYIRSFSTFVRQESDEYFNIDKLEISLSQTIEAGRFGLSLSRDGVLWSDMYFREFGGQYDTQLQFRPSGGLGRYQGYAGIQMYTTSNVHIATDRLIA